MVVKTLMRLCREANSKDSSKDMSHASGELTLRKEECGVLTEMVDDGMAQRIQEYESKLWVAEKELESERMKMDEMLRRTNSRNEAHKELFFNICREKELSDQLAQLLRQERDEYALLSQKFQMERAVYTQLAATLQETVDTLRTQLEVVSHARGNDKTLAKHEAEDAGREDREMARVVMENVQLREELDLLSASLQLHRRSNEQLAIEKDRLLEQLYVHKRALEVANSERRVDVCAPSPTVLSPHVELDNSEVTMSWANDLYPPLPAIIANPPPIRGGGSDSHEQPEQLFGGSSPSGSPSSSLTSPMSSNESVLCETQHQSPASEIEEIPCLKEAESMMELPLFKGRSPGSKRTTVVEHFAPRSGRSGRLSDRRRWMGN
eukprot:TRINITY_DN20135_c0_g1_i1.p1 TRINITY_DN20135_c0_g1~~TRINITY_DN20135_c0_g1_i1.p1  ORF type:complete len:380 (-),score=87.98 TRINITY_DN20135_c0_g1_i1:151-1290(-)